MIGNALPKSLQDNPFLDAWLDFGTPGVVGLLVGKVELGQGIATALAQIAAEELDVAMSAIRLRAGDTDATPDEGTTSSSLSVEVSGASVRLVCAEAAGLFRAAAAAALGCDAAALRIEGGAMLRDGAATGLDYWILAADVALHREATGAVAPKPVGTHRVVGTAVPRIDLLEKLAGGGLLHDVHVPGLRHARVLRQPRPDAVLVELDAAAVARAAGAPIDLLRVGSFVAVIAEREVTARRAVEAATRLARWDGAAPVPAGAEEAAWLLDQPAQTVRHGAPDAGAAATVTAEFSRPYTAHASIGPSCALAWELDGHLTVLSHTQGAHGLRRSIAQALGRTVESVTVRHVAGPGCYGHNGADDAAFDAAVIAVHRPGVKLRVQWSRADEFGFEPVGPAMVIRLAASVDAAGRPVDLTTEIWSGVHTDRIGGFLAAAALPDRPARPPKTDPTEAGGGGGTRNAVPLYDIPASRIVHHLVPGTPVRTSSLRGLGAVPNVFALEGLMDMLAAAAGADPVAYRLGLLSDPRARHVIEAVTALSGWATRPRGEGVGMGIGFARYKNRSAYAAVVAEVAVEAEIRLLQAWCVADAGLVVNPDGARNQLEGGIVQAASWVLKEQLRLDADGVASRDWESYPILRFSEVPEIETRLVDAAALPPLGMGEASMGPAAGAIGNAVAAALATRLTALPLTRARVAAALLA